MLLRDRGATAGRWIGALIVGCALLLGASAPQPVTAQDVVAMLIPPNLPTVMIGGSPVGRNVAAGLRPGDGMQLSDDADTSMNYPNIATCYLRGGVFLGIGTPADNWLFTIIDGGRGDEQFCHLLSGVQRVGTLFGYIEMTGTTVGIAQHPTGMTATVFEGSAVLVSPVGRTEIREGESFELRQTFGGFEVTQVGRAELTDTELRRMVQIGGLVAPSLVATTLRSGRFRGTVTLNQAPVQGEATVEALVGGVVCGSARVGSSADMAGPALINPQTGIAIVTPQIPTTYAVEVASAVTRRGCAKDGDTVTFRLRRAGDLIPLAPTATFRAGAETQVDLTNGVPPGSGNQPGLCAPLSAVSLTATPTGPLASSNRVQWQATGGCAPFTGTITARYRSGDGPYRTYPIAAASGTIADQAPERCQGTFPVDYTVELFDGRGTRVTRTASSTVYFLC